MGRLGRHFGARKPIINYWLRRGRGREVAGQNALFWVKIGLASGCHGPINLHRAKQWNGSSGMMRGRQLATIFSTLTVLASMSANGYAAQCGSTAAGFETWKREFAAEARGKGVERRDRRRPDGDELCERDHRRRSRPEKLSPVARSVPRQARGLDHRRARSLAEAIPRGAVRVDPATLRRPAGTADRDLGNGDRLRKPARQSEHAVGRRHARLRLPPVGVSSPSSSTQR